MGNTYKRFSEQVCKIVDRRDMKYCDISILDTLMNKVMPNINVFDVRIVFGILN